MCDNKYVRKILLLLVLIKHFETSFWNFRWRRGKAVYDSVSPHQEKFPDKWGEEMTRLQSLIILRCLRPDKVSIWRKISGRLNKSVIVIVLAYQNLEKCCNSKKYEDSTCVPEYVCFLYEHTQACGMTTSALEFPEWWTVPILRPSLLWFWKQINQLYFRTSSGKEPRPITFNLSNILLDKNMHLGLAPNRRWFCLVHGWAARFYFLYSCPWGNNGFIFPARYYLYIFS